MALSDNNLVPFNTYCCLEWSLVELDDERAECHAIDPQYCETVQSVISIGWPSLINYSSAILCHFQCYLV